MALRKHWCWQEKNGRSAWCWGQEDTTALLLTVVLVGVLVELHRCDTCGKVFSYPCAEFGCFPYDRHRTLQTQQRLGQFLLCIGLCHLRGEQGNKAPAWLLFNGTSGCVRSSRRNCYNEETVYWKKKKDHSVDRKLELTLWGPLPSDRRAAVEWAAVQAASEPVVCLSWQVSCKLTKCNCQFRGGQVVPIWSSVYWVQSNL